MQVEKPAGLTLGPLRIGDWIYYPSLLRIQRGEEHVRLEPLVGHLLLFFSARAGQTVSREELMVGVWPNRVVIDDALTGAIGKLRKALGDDRRNPVYLETIPKLGYRLIAPVEHLPASQAPPYESASDNGAAVPLPLHKRWIIALTIVIVGVILAVAINPQRSSDEADLARGGGEGLSSTPMAQPTLLILPFDNLSDDSAQEYFTEGIVEDVITDLSRIESIRVLARNTSFQYKGKKVDPQQIARDLRVSHIVEGSVRRSGETLRITARLIDTSNSQNLWSQRYDRSTADVFEMQTDVAEKIAVALSKNLTEEQRIRISSRPTDSIEAYDLYLKGRKALSLRTPEANAQARDYYRQAILLDPDFARAYGGIAAALTRYANKGWSTTPDVERDLALHYAKKAVEISPDSAYSLWALGFTHLYRQENGDAESAVLNALAVSPGYADGLALLAQIYNYSGKAHAAIDLIEKAIPINPLYSWDYLFNLGWAHYNLGHYETAAEYQLKALERNENATFARLNLVAAYMALGLTDDAEWQAEEVLAYQPNMSIRFLKRETPITSTSEKTRQYLSSLQAAGIPAE